jgi:hypothetical protein
MIRIDSLKAQFNRNFISFNPENFNKTTTQINDVETDSFHLKDKYKILGLKNIRINENDVKVELSAKYIPTEYPEMIHINNVETYFNTINKSKIIIFNPIELIENMELLTCDLTQNIIMPNDVKDYINALSIFKLNNKYHCKIFENESVTFLKKAKTNYLKEHLIIYNKYPELLLAQNTELRNQLDIESFKNKLRFESKFTTLKAIRNALNITDNKLTSVLNSTAKIHYNIFNKITDISNIDIEIFNNYKTIIKMRKFKKRSEIRNLLGDLEIIKALNLDIDLIKIFVNANSTANNSKTIRYYKQLTKSVIDIKNESDIDNKVNEIKEMLLVA